MKVVENQRQYEQYFYAVYTIAFKPYTGLCVCALWRKR